MVLSVVVKALTTGLDTAEDSRSVSTGNGRIVVPWEVQER
jgi:hypothetical protein